MGVLNPQIQGHLARHEFSASLGGLVDHSRLAAVRTVRVHDAGL